MAILDESGEVRITAQAGDEITARLYKLSPTSSSIKIRGKLSNLTADSVNIGTLRFALSDFSEIRFIQPEKMMIRTGGVVVAGIGIGWQIVSIGLFITAINRGSIGYLLGSRLDTLMAISLLTVSGYAIKQKTKFRLDGRFRLVSLG